MGREWDMSLNRALAVKIIFCGSAFMSVTAASAASCQAGGATLDDAGATYQGCFGATEGNDTGNNSRFLDLLNQGIAFAGFGSGDTGFSWSMLGKTDEGGDPVTGTG